MQFVPKLLIFTCNKDPQAWYDWSKCAHPMGALVRRITNQWCYVKQVRPEWGLNELQLAAGQHGHWFSYAIRELGAADFHPARKCMHFIKPLPGGQDLYGIDTDDDMGGNVEPEDADKFFV